MGEVAATTWVHPVTSFWKNHETVPTRRQSQASGSRPQSVLLAPAG